MSSGKKSWWGVAAGGVVAVFGLLGVTACGFVPAGEIDGLLLGGLTTVGVLLSLD